MSKIKGVVVTGSKKCTDNAATFKEIIIINNNSAKLYDFLQLIPWRYHFMKASKAAQMK